MLHKTILTISLVLALSSLVAAQNTNSSTPNRPRTTNTNTSTPPASPQKSTDTQSPTTTPPAAARRTEAKPKIAAPEVPGSAGATVKLAQLRPRIAILANAFLQRDDVAIDWGGAFVSSKDQARVIALQHLRRVISGSDKLDVSSHHARSPQRERAK